MAMRAIFYSNGKRIGQLEVIKGKVVAEGLPPRIVKDLQSGDLKVIGAEGLKLPIDGDDFIKALPYAFRSPYLAAEVK
jgi:hypothetical protein